MKSRQIRNSLLLVLTALIWGVAFVAQSTGGDAVGPFSFNGIRSLIGSAVLVPVIFLLDKMGLGSKKPQTKEEVLSLYSILDRCVLPAEIFEILERTKPGAGGEIQLTDAMREIAVTKGMTAVEFEGKRYDMGNKFGILQAQIEVGLEHPETKDQLKEYIKEIAKTL